MQGQETKWTIPRKKKIAFSFYLQRQFSNHNGITHVLPSQSLLEQPREHVTTECFRPLAGFFFQLTGQALRSGHNYTRRKHMIARPFPGPQPIESRLSSGTNGNEAERGRLVTQGQWRRDLERDHVARVG